MPFPGHHPDLHLVGWNNVKIDVWTHSVSKWFMWFFFFSSLFWFMWHLGKSLVLASFQIIHSKTRHHLGHNKSDDQAIFPSLNLLLQGFGHCYQSVCNFPIQITRPICVFFSFALLYLYKVLNILKQSNIIFFVRNLVKWICKRKYELRTGLCNYKFALGKVC